MSNVVYLSTHPRFPVKASDYDELTLGNATSVANHTITFSTMPALQFERLAGQGDVIKVIEAEAQSLLDEAFRARALGQESVGKLKEETAKYLLSLVASLPTKLRGQ